MEGRFGPTSGDFVEFNGIYIMRFYQGKWTWYPLVTGNGQFGSMICLLKMVMFHSSIKLFAGMGLYLIQELWFRECWYFTMPVDKGHETCIIGNGHCLWMGLRFWMWVFFSLLGVCCRSCEGNRLMWPFLLMEVSALSGKPWGLVIRTVHPLNPGLVVLIWDSHGQVWFVFVIAHGGCHISIHSHWSKVPVEVQNHFCHMWRSRQRWYCLLCMPYDTLMPQCCGWITT